MEITQTKSNTNSHGPSSSLQRLQDYSSDCLTFSDTSHSSHTEEGALMFASMASPPSGRGSLMQKLRSLPSVSELSTDHSFKLELLEYRQNRSLRASPAVRNYVFSFFLSFLFRHPNTFSFMVCQRPSKFVTFVSTSQSACHLTAVVKMMNIK